MSLLDVIRTIVISFQPFRYCELANERSKKLFRHMSTFIILVFLLSTTLSIPGFLGFKSNLEDELAKVKTLEIKGDLQTRGPVTLTSGVVLDTSETKTMITTEKVLITRDNLYFNFWTPMKIRVEKLLRPMNYKTQFVSAITFLVLFLVPSVILFLLGLFFIKYALITLLTGAVIFFFLRVLLLVRIRARNVFNVCFLAAFPPVLLESLVSPFFSRLLVPVFGVLTFKIYLIPVLIYIGLAVIGMVLSEKKFKFEHFKRKKDRGENAEEEKFEWGF